MRLLIVDEDAVVRRDVANHLEHQGVSVTAVATMAAALEAVDRTTFTAAILSLALPDGSGLEILRTLRTHGAPTHVIVLSGAASVADRVQALELGADDYVMKPFFVRELTARVLAVGRRQIASTDRLLVYGTLAIDLASRTVTLDGVERVLTAMEFDLLAFLAARPGHAFSREELLGSVWHSSGDWQQESTVTEHMRRLRAKIESDPHDPHLLQTVRGIGYRFDPSDADQPDEPSTPFSPPPALVPGTFVLVDGKVVHADETAVEMFGATSETELLGRDELELVAPQSITALRARRVARAAGFSPGSQIVAIRSPDGTDAYVELSSAWIEWDHQPALTKTMALSQDPGAGLRHIVTGVVSEMSDAVIVTDPHFHIRSWNDAAQRFYGWAEHEVIGRRVDDVLRIIGPDGVQEAARQTMDEKGRWFGELSVIARDGARVNVSCSSSVVRDDIGKPVFVVGVHRLVVVSPRVAAPPPPSATRTDEGAIRRGFDDNEFRASFQPVVALRHQTVVAVEASTRWDHPALGLVTPAQLVDASEHVAAMVEVERMTFEQACRETAAWHRAGTDLDLAVHLSNAQLAELRLFDDIAATLADSGLDPHALWLEVTETALVEDLELAAHILQRLAQLGTRVAVDNFGIGWASLAYLKELPVHALKIDRHFVADVADDFQDAAIIRSILALGKELDLVVIADGVDTAAQHGALLELGCRFGQGALFGPPVPAADILPESAHT
jgi:PAS domain S-box-containing protein